MGDICGDNRFEIIAKAKKKLLESTNIHTSEDEMKVLDSFLFRCWQMGWLERFDKPREPLDIPTMSTDFIKEYGGLPCPEGYIFKDENGNIINATKIVLEKKKKKYPKTYQECCKELNIAVRDLDILYNMLDTTEMVYSKNLDRLLNSFRKLRICRDAYWKIAGEEMGLGKPWKPDWTTNDVKHSLINVGNTIIPSVKSKVCRILAFPTKEMRDVFKENFDPDIEFCKELL